MKLLLDHNLSPRLVHRLADCFTVVSHVAHLGLDQASDETVWQYARAYDYTIVSKDSDFLELSEIYRSPPKVIWLRLGNCTTREAEAALRQNAAALSDFDLDPEGRVLTILRS